MISNYKKPKPPKGWKKLTDAERDELVKFQEESIRELTEINVNHEEAELQKVWLMMGCIANHDVFKAGGIRARRWLHRWKRLYHKISTFKTAEERDAYLDAEMEKIFGKGGYPAEWVDSLEK